MDNDMPYYQVGYQNQTASGSSSGGGGQSRRPIGGHHSSSHSPSPYSSSSDLMYSGYGSRGPPQSQPSQSYNHPHHHNPRSNTSSERPKDPYAQDSKSSSQSGGGGGGQYMKRPYDSYQDDLIYPDAPKNSRMMSQSSSQQSSAPGYGHSSYRDEPDKPSYESVHFSSSRGNGNAGGDHPKSHSYVPPAIPQPTSSINSTLEKYFSSDEIKRFNEYNRFLVMSSPGRHKKFYASLSSTDYKRFCDFLDFEEKGRAPVGPGNGKSSSHQMPPIPQQQQQPPQQQQRPPPQLPPEVPMIPPPPIPIKEDPYQDRHRPSQPARFPSSYSTSYYNEPPKQLPPPYEAYGSVVQAAPVSMPPIPMNYPPPPVQALQPQNTVSALSSSLPYFVSDVFERSLEAKRFSDFEKNLTITISNNHNNNNNSVGDRGFYRPPPPRRSRFSRSPSPRYSSRRGRSRSSSRSRSQSPLRDRGRNRSRNRTRTRSRSPESRFTRPKKVLHRDLRSPLGPRKTLSDGLTRRERARARGQTAQGPAITPATESDRSKNNRKLTPYEENKYLKLQVEQIKNIHKLKLKELDDIKRRDKNSEDSYIFKKVSASVMDIEKRLAQLEKDLKANQKILDDMEVKNKKETDSATDSKYKFVSTKLSASKSVNSRKESTTTVAGSDSSLAKKSADDKDKKTKSSQPATPINNANNKSSDSLSKSKLADSRKSESVERRAKELGNRQPTPDRYMLTDEEHETAMYQFEWCSSCDMFFESQTLYLTHLHRENHLNSLRQSDFLIMRKAEEKVDNQLAKQLENAAAAAANTKDSDPDNNEAFLGSEFLYPSKSFYCDLCAKFMLTAEESKIHLKSKKHINLYKKYIQKYKDYPDNVRRDRKSSFYRQKYILHDLIYRKSRGEFKSGSGGKSSTRRTSVDDRRSGSRTHAIISQLMNELVDKVASEAELASSSLVVSSSSSSSRKTTRGSSGSHTTDNKSSISSTNKSSVNLGTSSKDKSTTIKSTEPSDKSASAADVPISKRKKNTTTLDTKTKSAKTTDTVAITLNTKTSKSTPDTTPKSTLTSTPKSVPTPKKSPEKSVSTPPIKKTRAAAAAAAAAVSAAKKPPAVTAAKKKTSQTTPAKKAPAAKSTPAAPVATKKATKSSLSPTKVTAKATVAAKKRAANAAKNKKASGPKKIFNVDKEDSEEEEDGFEVINTITTTADAPNFAATVFSPAGNARNGDQDEKSPDQMEEEEEEDEETFEVIDDQLDKKDGPAVAVVAGDDLYSMMTLADPDADKLIADESMDSPGTSSSATIVDDDEVDEVEAADDEVDEVEAADEDREEEEEEIDEEKSRSDDGFDVIDEVQ